MKDLVERTISEELSVRVQQLKFEMSANAYLAWLRENHPEHFMESTPHAHQRMITVESLDLVAARRPDFHLFNELLIQYRRRRDGVIQQVVPDNMVVLHAGAIDAVGSYDVPLQPAPPFWVIEYVSKGSERKDFEESLPKYERELKVPYLLHYYHDVGEMSLFRHNRRKYVTVKPNKDGRFAIAEVELELGLVEGWVRYWYQGELLALPPELQKELDTLRAENAELQRQLSAREEQTANQRRRADLAEQHLAALHTELERLRGRPAS